MFNKTSGVIKFSRMRTTIGDMIKVQEVKILTHELTSSLSAVIEPIDKIVVLSLNININVVKSNNLRTETTTEVATNNLIIEVKTTITIVIHVTIMKLTETAGRVAMNKNYLTSVKMKKKLVGNKHNCLKT